MLPDLPLGLHVPWLTWHRCTRHLLRAPQVLLPQGVAEEAELPSIHGSGLLELGFKHSQLLPIRPITIFHPERSFSSDAEFSTAHVRAVSQPATGSLVADVKRWDTNYARTCQSSTRRGLSPLNPDNFLIVCFP